MVLITVQLAATSLCPELMQPLPDLLLNMPFLFDRPAPPKELPSWSGFIDFQLLTWVLLMLLTLAWRRDLVRVAEMAALECILLTAKAVAQVVTTIPNSNSQKQCDARGSPSLCKKQAIA